jgi:hypothetical protein
MLYASLSCCVLCANEHRHESGGYGMNGEVARWVAEEESGKSTSRLTYLQLDGPSDWSKAKGGPRGGQLYHVAKI